MAAMVMPMTFMLVVLMPTRWSVAVALVVVAVVP